jgi:hypothetical protein
MQLSARPSIAGNLLEVNPLASPDYETSIRVQAACSRHHYKLTDWLDRQQKRLS